MTRTLAQAQLMTDRQFEEGAHFTERDDDHVADFQETSFLFGFRFC